MTKEEINKQYSQQHGMLEKEYFDIVDEGTRTQRRQLKKGKVQTMFDQRHSELQWAKEAELNNLPKEPTKVAKLEQK